jgi:protein-disulfide isomerase
MQKEAEQLGIRGTPTFFISVDGGTPYQVQPDAYTVEAFAPIFEDALQGS